MAGDNWNDFLKLFTVDPFPDVYVLGCFARYGTLYSQQVRALNLVAALSAVGKIHDGAQVAVVGGGAAGLTASAAAALLGANVTLLEKLDGLIELQRNNRQRWIHPHIYDWPDPDVDGDRARLPILDWQASYAEVVAEQLERQWNEIRSRTQPRLKAHYPLRSIQLRIAKRIPWLKWTGHSQADRAFQVIILAVGKGLEPDHVHQWSYWQEDDIDASFRARGEGARWLVSGYGDSALTDLMRLCIKRFRQAELPTLFKDHDRDAVESVIKDLREINDDPKAADNRYLTEWFERLETRGLEKVLDQRLRRQGFRPCLTGDGPYLYDPRASTLNRLILRLLQKLDAFDHYPGPVVGKPKRTSKSFQVELAGGPQRFERLLLRHGPVAALDKSFGKLPKSCSILDEAWKKLPRNGDVTRKRKWRIGLFGPEDAPAAHGATRSTKQVGVTARGLTVTKELLSDGRSSLKYQIEGLKVLEGELTGVRYLLESTVGVIGGPELDAIGHQLGTWDPDPQPDIPLAAPMEDRIQAVRDNARIRSGVLRFKTALTSASDPVSFGLTVFQLNADALSTWEFQQLYREDQRQHLDHSEIQNLEFFACMVWFPIETLKVQLTFPSGYDCTPRVSLFRCPVEEIPADEVVRDQVLHLSPDHESALATSRIRWQPVTPPDPDWTLGQVDVTRTWELQVSKPAMGSCYSLDWDLPAAAENEVAKRLRDEARAFRDALLTHRAADTVHRHFLAFSEELHRICADPRPGEWFEVVWMTYNDVEHMLEPADAVVNGGTPGKDLWEFKLPFGLGLAGAAFKAARGFLFVRPERSNPEYFLDVPGFSKAEVLVALPLDHPDFENAPGSTRSHQCIGVMDISSNFADSRLLEVFKSKQLDEVAGLCKSFSKAVFKAVMLS